MLPSIDQLGSMSGSQLQAALATIDLRLSDLHMSDGGELRELTRNESQEFDELKVLRDRVEAHMNVRGAYDRAPHAVQGVGEREPNRGGRPDPNAPPLLTRSQSISDWVQHSRPEGYHAGVQLSFAKIARGLATGNWRTPRWSSVPLPNHQRPPAGT
jgi:hypothetical protein